MWNKTDQAIIWSSTYSPLVIIMIFRFVSSNDFFQLESFKKTIFDGSNFLKTPVAMEIYFILFTLFITVVIYYCTIQYYLSKYDEKLKPGKHGKDYYLRGLEKLSANDYSFFLLTLLLPLISLDHSSVINLAISLIVIIFVIGIYVKTDAISVCPLFFFSGRKVFKATISRGTKEEENVDPSLRKDVVIIVKEENIDLNNAVRGEELIGEVYYITKGN
ncbi:hypothetical protein [Salsuginibacillus kocurii]|uniref:hypothetical protein n=1 Tax=Salsuginibacillus kocurii TaxID=427078 RepID=UPI00036F06F6|nr:hypothetical protein [Salsuginibacillus kocurii]